METTDQTLKEIIDNATQRATRREKVDAEEFIYVPRYKMMKDGVVAVPAQQISAPQIAVSLIKNEIKVQHNHFGEGVEVMVLILLNLDNYPILTQTVAVGTTTHVFVDPAQVFSLVLSPHFGTRSFILGHNHPSGSIHLSEEDKLMLKDFKRWGSDFNRPLRDFIVIGDGSSEYYSHRNETYEL